MKVVPARYGARTTVQLLKHMDASLQSRWKSYRRRLKRCRKKCSRPAVHALRVETRRLLSLVELLSAVVRDDRQREVRRELKRRLDSFDDLRDTQVQTRIVIDLRHAFPELKELRDRLLRREKRLIRRLAKEVRDTRVTLLTEDIGTLRRQVRALSTSSASRKVVFGKLIRAVDRSHAKAVDLRRQIVGSDPATIHRTRVAFKKFRYMVESLRPVLSGLPRKQLEEMHDYQALMGDIQDLEVLLKRTDKFVAQQKLEYKPLLPFSRELARQRKALIKEYLRRADQLLTFWSRQRNVESA